MEFIKNNYTIVIFIGLFIVFALIGYIIDILRSNSNSTSEERTIVPSEVKSIQLDKVLDEEEKVEPEEEKEDKKVDDDDDLLKSYEDEM